jgi:Domain of unknown function DUF29
MTQELSDLKNCLREGRYDEALVIVDELEGMSKQDILRKIESFLVRLLIQLIKNQLEQRLTNSWAASIRGSLVEIKKLNLKDNKNSFYVNETEWLFMLEEVFEIAIRDASLEVFNGAYTSFQVTEMVDITQIIPVAQSLLSLTYNYSKKDLPGVIDEFLTQLPGGQDWREGR